MLHTPSHQQFPVLFQLFFHQIESDCVSVHLHRRKLFSHSEEFIDSSYTREATLGSEGGVVTVATEPLNLCSYALSSAGQNTTS